MKLTVHKCVLNAMTAPNPTQYSKLDKYRKKTTPKSDWVECGIVTAYVQVSSKHTRRCFVSDSCRASQGSCGRSQMPRPSSPMLCAGREASKTEHARRHVLQGIHGQYKYLIQTNPFFFLSVFLQFAHLRWIWSGDAVQKALTKHRFRRFGILFVFFL